MDGKLIQERKACSSNPIVDLVRSKLNYLSIQLSENGWETPEAYI
jgi:hypothetical protein